MPGRRPHPEHWWICDECGLCTCPCCEDYYKCVVAAPARCHGD